MKVIDTHAHINSMYFKDDFDELLLKIKDMLIINISVDIQSSIENISLYKKNSNLIPTIGIHPCDSNEYTRDMSKKIEDILFSNLNNVFAIGEIGLDYFHKNNKEKQKQSFVAQLELARKYKIPVVIHTRDSLGDTYEILKEYSDLKILLHSWSGDEKLTNKFLKISNTIYFSYNGIITFKNAKLQKEIIKMIPLNKLMFETDSPFLSPEPFRGKKNIPSRVKNVIEYSAKILNKSFDELNDINSKNAITFFNLNKENF